MTATIQMLWWFVVHYSPFRSRIPAHLVLIALLGTGGMWMIDITNVIEGSKYAKNGWFDVSTEKLYHIGFYASLITLWLLVFIKGGDKCSH